MFKIEIEDGHGIWSDVRGADGAVMTFGALSVNVGIVAYIGWALWRRVRAPCA